MENDGNGNGRGHYFPWDYWDLGSSSSRLDWNAFHPTPFGSDDQSHLMMTMVHPSGPPGANAHPSFQGGDSAHPPSDPHHLTCLKLGKRHYFAERQVPSPKRGRAFPVPSGSAPVPRCQVEGCHVALLNAKDYHRRHKVCEMHSKAPRVVVLGIEQRFCQQCSRFHVVSEFDDSKRSCRRRLAGHNERRRKSANESILSRNASQESKHMDGRFPCIPPSTTTGCALSLLSSKSSSWVPSADLSSRSSAALRELIAENRAALLARQLMSDRSWNHGVDDAGGAQALMSNIPHTHQVASSGPDESRLVPVLDHFHEPAAHVTLDLMQRPNASFQILSNRGKSKEEEEGCCEIWRSLEGTHVV